MSTGWLRLRILYRHFRLRWRLSHRHRVVASPVLGLFLATSAIACFGPNPDVTDRGKGLPQVEIEFPASAEPGAILTAEITVANPGPGDMTSVVIAFTRVGNDYPILDVGTKGTDGAVVGIDPEPVTAEPGRFIYRFGPLPEGESQTYSFDLRIPMHAGVVANAVTAYDGQETDRVKGARLATTVE